MLINSRDAENRQKMLEMSAKMNEMSARLEQYTRLERITPEIQAEMKSLFPQISAVSLSRVVQASRDTVATRQFVAAIITVDIKAHLTAKDRERLHDWLQTRVEADSLVVY